MSEPFVGEIRMFGGNFAPRGWAFCDGALLSVNNNNALFSLVGPIYGGDGRTTFGLPDLRGRVPVHQGSGPGLTPRALGANGGVERVAITTAQIPQHNHEVAVASTAGDADLPGGNVRAQRTGVRAYRTGAPLNVMLNGDSVLPSGGGQTHNNLMPFQCVNFIIALFGVYPSRN